ncbi:hypothetical protein NIES3974_19510 [Calothrix sp. NIES-3974]|nr:hypothetical protein NIES3974_19510 [Calothrix sp. NIES-3974]
MTVKIAQYIRHPAQTRSASAGLGTLAKPSQKVATTKISAFRNVKLIVHYYL